MSLRGGVSGPRTAAPAMASTSLVSTSATSSRLCPPYKTGGGRAPFGARPAGSMLSLSRCKTVEEVEVVLAWAGEWVLPLWVLHERQHLHPRLPLAVPGKPA